MSDRDFTFQGQNFKLNKLDAFMQYHVVRILSPMLSEMIPVLMSLKDAKDDALTPDQQLGKFGEIAAPLLTGFSKLGEKESEEVLIRLLYGVEIQRNGVWARVSNGKALMFHDLELPTLLTAAGRSIAYNLAGFLAVLPKVSPSGM